MSEGSPVIEPSEPAPGHEAAGHETPHHEPPPVTPHAGLRYSLYRFVVLLAVGAVLYLFGLRDWLLLLLAFAISGVVSYFVLMRTRDAAAANIEHTIEVRREAHHAHENAAPPQGDVAG